MALVEQHLGAAGHGGHDARLACGAADGADAALVAEADLADRERGLGVAAKLSRRSSIGVAPACAAWPVNTATWRSTPQVPSTVAAGSPRLSSTGPCSMWSSR